MLKYTRYAHGCVFGLRILIVTGKLAEPIIKKMLKKALPHEVDVIALPVTVAALANTELIANYLKGLGIDCKKYDLIMIPGASMGSAKAIEKELGVKAVKGPLQASDLPLVLSLEEIPKLSPDEPADKVLEDELQTASKKMLESLEKSLIEKEHIIVGNIIVPTLPPPIRVMAEITEAHTLSKDTLLKKANKLVSEGAEILSIGFEAGVSRPEKVRETIRFLKKELQMPIAVDSIIPSEIIAGTEAGADMVLSLEAGNIEKVAKYVEDIPSVVIAYDSRSSVMPKTAQEKLKLLEANISEAIRLGVKKVIADPILDPINSASTFQSLLAYHRFKEKHKNTPTLMGIGNVVELLDADTVGSNALMVMLALELGVSIVLVVEKSPKAQYSTFEASIASRMASLAWLKKSPPKDLGIDLLILKDKRKVETPLETEGATIVEAIKEEAKYELDPLGVFKIRVNHDEECIEALYIGKKGKILIKGRTARAIRDEILRRGLISSLSHAFYLGIELSKAEEALTIGKNYIQEKTLFTRKTINM